jgi:hypothetical protein
MMRLMPPQRPRVYRPVRVQVPPAAVETTVIPTREGWTWAQARHLILQGYTPERAAQMSGAPVDRLRAVERQVARELGRAARSEAMVPWRSTANEHTSSPT